MLIKFKWIFGLEQAGCHSIQISFMDSYRIIWPYFILLNDYISIYRLTTKLRKSVLPIETYNYISSINFIFTALFYH